ncbi:uncharacterized protein V1516DRAFT_697895 [Lipomyces oligophaga]|uniref:uncharacterized protein n=1 Tax=Lipomyces oligophaga TaxID=45792 RepID=UPI0034CE8C97
MITNQDLIVSWKEVVIPPWQHDNEVSHCPYCHRAFGLFFRRHHCRICGRVVCGSCSNNFIPFPPGTYVLSPYQREPEHPGTLLRVCDDCIREPDTRAASLAYSSSTQLSETYSSFPHTPDRGQFETLLAYGRSQRSSSPNGGLFSKGALMQVPRHIGEDVSGYPGSSSSSAPSSPMVINNNVSSRRRTTGGAAATHLRQSMSLDSRATSNSSAEPVTISGTSSSTGNAGGSASASSTATTIETVATTAPSATNRLTSAFRFVGGWRSSSSSLPSSSDTNTGHGGRHDEGLGVSLGATKTCTVESTIPESGRRSSGTGSATQHRSGFRLVSRRDNDDSGAPRGGAGRGEGGRAGAVGSTSRILEVEEEDDEQLCPICGIRLKKMKSEQEREQHINDCLTKATFSGAAEQQHRRNRMVVYRLDGSQVGKECVICFEDFKAGDVVARLECLCVYHRKCIKAWFEKKGVGECPIHAVNS